MASSIDEGLLATGYSLFFERMTDEPLLELSLILALDETPEATPPSRALQGEQA